jgi:LysR family transcriptional regulator, chromosome initiation inhibitor
MLDARQLEALAAVIEHGSFKTAAQVLSLTLAAVSLRVKSLEATLGQRLLVRGKKLHATPSGQALLAHVKQLRLMEADLLDALPGASARGAQMQSISVAVNADSMASWFLPGVSPACKRHRLLLDVVVDDQDHTHDALKNGDVSGCVTTRADAMRGCIAEPLGIMRYRCVAAPDLLASWRAVDGSVSIHRMLRSPAVIFNRKDALQDAFLAQHFELQQARYPRHFVPAVDAFEQAIELGMGWGMVSELQQAVAAPTSLLEEVFPGRCVDVVLYWQHWAKEPVLAQRLTAAVKEAGLGRLLQV